MADIYSTGVMLGVVEDLKRPVMFFLARFYPSVSTEDSEEIHFDVEKGGRKVAPFVSPMVKGQVMTDEGYNTSSFKPAYVKPKHVVDPNQPLKRMAGERIGGSLSPADRILANLGRLLMKQVDMIDRRKELMAVEAMRTGKVTVTGEKYPTVVVDFGRDAAHTIVKGGGTKWGDAGIKPLSDLKTWANMVLKAEGVFPNDVVMDADAWEVFSADAEVVEKLKRPNPQTPNLDTGAAMEEGGNLMGTIDNFNIWVYQAWYEDDAGVTQPSLPSGTVIMSSVLVGGVQAHGAIRDERAGYQALEYFPKSWTDEDPSARYVMTQSAPLPVPTRINATLAATVL